MRLLPFLLGILLWSDLYAAGAGVGAGAGARTPTAKPKKKKREYTPYSQLPFEGKVMRRARVLRDLKKNPEFQKRREALTSHTEDEAEEFKYLQTEAHIKYVIDGISGATYEEAPEGGETDAAHMKRFMRNLHTFSTKSGIDSRTIPTMDTETAHMITHFDSEGIPQTIQGVFEEMVTNELKHKNRYAFYHGTCNRIGFLMEILTELRSRLTISPKTDIRTLRAFEKAFDRLSKVQEFIRYHEGVGGRVHDHAASFKDQGISTNVFLFGNYKFAGECTFLYWISARSIDPPKIDSILRDLFQSLGLSETEADRVTKDLILVEAMHKLKKRGGLLLQILAAPEIVDEVGYISWAYGVPLKVGENVLYPSRLMSIVRNDPQAGEEFLKDNVSLDRGYEGTTDYLSAIQARYFLKPDYLQDSSKVMTLSRWRHPLSAEKQKAYKKDFTRVIHRAMKRIIGKERQQSPGSMGTQGSRTKESPLLTLAHFMKSKGQSAHKIFDEVTESNIADVLSTAFSEQNAEKARAFFQGRPIDEKISAVDKTPLRFVIEIGDLRWVKFLIENGAPLDDNQEAILDLIAAQREWAILTQFIDDHTFSDFTPSRSLMIALGDDGKADLAKRIMSLGDQGSIMEDYLLMGIAQGKNWRMLAQFIDDHTFSVFSGFITSKLITGLVEDDKIDLIKQVMALSILHENSIKEHLLEQITQGKKWHLLQVFIEDHIFTSFSHYSAIEVLINSLLNDGKFNLAKKVISLMKDDNAAPGKALFLGGAVAMKQWHELDAFIQGNSFDGVTGLPEGKEMMNALTDHKKWEVLKHAIQKGFEFPSGKQKLEAYTYAAQNDPDLLTAFENTYGYGAYLNQYYMVDVLIGLKKWGKVKEYLSHVGVKKIKRYAELLNHIADTRDASLLNDYIKCFGSGRVSIDGNWGYTPLAFFMEKNLLDFTNTLLQKDAKFGVWNSTNRRDEKIQSIIQAFIKRAFEENKFDLLLLFRKKAPWVGSQMRESFATTAQFTDNESIRSFVDTKLFASKNEPFLKELILVSNSYFIATGAENSFYKVVKKAIKSNDGAFLGSYIEILKAHPSKKAYMNLQYQGLYTTILNIASKKKDQEVVQYLINHVPGLGESQYDSATIPFILKTGGAFADWFIARVAADLSRIDARKNKYVKDALLREAENNNLPYFKKILSIFPKTGPQEIKILLKDLIEKDAAPFAKEVIDFGEVDVKKDKSHYITRFTVGDRWNQHFQGQYATLLDYALKNKKPESAVMLMGAPYNLRADKLWNVIIGHSYSNANDRTIGALLHQKLYGALRGAIEAGVVLTDQSREALASSGDEEAVALSFGSGEKVEEAAFMGALKANNEALIRKMLDKGVSATEKSVLWLLARRKYDLVEELIKKYPETRTSGVLVECIRFDQKNLVKFLIANGGDVSSKVKRKWGSETFPLLRALNREEPSFEIVQALLETHAKDYDDQALHEAAGKGFKIFKSCYDVLMGHDGDLNRVNAKQQSLLFPVLSSGDLQTVAFVLEKEPNATLIDEKGNTVLHGMNFSQNIEHLPALLKMGAQINHQNNEKYTPLDKVYGERYYGFDRHFEKFLERQLKKKAEDEAFHKEIGAIQKMKAAGAVVNQNYRADLRYELYRGTPAAVSAILEAHPESLNSDLVPLGYNHELGPLEVAILSGNTPVAEVLVDKGAAIREDYRSRFHPVVLALEKNDLTILSKILEKQKEKILARARDYVPMLLKSAYSLQSANSYYTADFPIEDQLANVPAIKEIMRILHTDKAFSAAFQGDNLALQKIVAGCATNMVTFPAHQVLVEKHSRWGGVDVQGWFSQSDEHLEEHLEILRVFGEAGGSFAPARGQSLFDLFLADGGSNAVKAGKILVDMALEHGVNIGFKQPNPEGQESTISGQYRALAIYALPLVANKNHRMRVADTFHMDDRYASAVLYKDTEILLQKTGQGWSLPKGRVYGTRNSSIKRVVKGAVQQELSQEEIDAATIYDVRVFEESGISYENKAYFMPTGFEIPADTSDKVWVPVSQLVLGRPHMQAMVGGEAHRIELDPKLVTMLQQQSFVDVLEDIRLGEALQKEEPIKDYVWHEAPLSTRVQVVEDLETIDQAFKEGDIILVGENASFQEVDAGRRALGDLSLVDEGLPKIVKHWQSSGAKVFGVTTRSYHGRKDILSQKIKETLGIDYTASLQGDDPTYFKLKDNRRLLAFANGILFQAHDHDGYGEIIDLFLQKWSENGGPKPGRVVVIDGQGSQVKSVANALEKLEAPHTVYWLDPNS